MLKKPNKNGRWNHLGQGRSSPESSSFFIQVHGVTVNVRGVAALVVALGIAAALGCAVSIAMAIR